MKSQNQQRRRGFTLLEAMVALLLMTIIAGAVFRDIDQAQQRSNSEQSKLDIFQETRDFLDQMTRDLHQAGYPNPHNFAPGLLPDPVPNNLQTAVGLVKIDYNELWFEGDVDGSGTVSSVQYYVDTEGNGCPCLRRLQSPKVSADPYSGQSAPDCGKNLAACRTIAQTEVQNVLNGSSNAPIFNAFDKKDSAVTLPVDFDNNGKSIANITTIKVMLTTESPYADSKTGLKPAVTLASTVKINNCSQAATGQTMSCQ